MNKIKDIFDLLKIITGSKDPMSIDIKNGLGKNNSIKRIASKSILQFPILTSSNVSTDTIKDVSRALEGEHATLIKIAMENDDTQKLDLKASNRNSSAKQDYVKRFHTNINNASIREAVSNIGNDDLNMEVHILGESKDPLDVQANLELLRPMTEELNHAILNNKFNANVTAIYEAEVADVKTALPNKNAALNELAPLIMNVEIAYITPKGDLEKTNITVGVKSVIHTVKATEFVEFLPSAIKNGSFIFRSIQFTTGETRFVRDFLLNLKDIKRKANTTGRGKTNSRWWKVLSRMSQVNKIMSYFNKNKFLPSTTMVISMDDVQAIKSEHGVDVLTRESALKLYKVYFLLGLVVVDENNGILYMFDEESENFKTVPLSQIKSQAKASSQGDFKSLMNLLSIR